MRTNIDIDDELLRKVLATGRFKTKREAVLEGLRMIIRLEDQLEIKKLRGAIPWKGNLDKMRRDKK